MAEWFDRIRDRYSRDHCLSEDASSSNWRGTNLATGKPVLIRYLPILEAPRQRLVARLESLAALSHPSLVQPEWSEPLEQGVLLVRPWMIQPSGVLSGESLQRKLAAVIRISEAMHAAHSDGVVHGALHEGNVLLDDRGMIVLCDFALPGANPGDETSWMSPQFRAGAAVQPSDDIYSLGVLLSRWLTGQDPGSPLPEQARLAQLREIGEVPAALARVMASLLSADPGHRPHSMLEVRERLEDARLSMMRAEESGIEDSDEDWQSRPAVKLEPFDLNPEPPSSRFSMARVLLTVAAVVVAFGLAIVLVVLPARIERDDASRRAEALAMAELEQKIELKRSAEAREASRKRELTPVELEALLAQKQSAQSVLDEFINLRLELEERSVERWAPDRFAQALETQSSGEHPFRQQSYPEAQAIYAQALQQLKTISALGEMVFAQALETGRSALEAGRSDEARTAFSLAFQIDAESEPARIGLERTETLDQVLALMAQADRAQLDGRWSDSLGLLKQVRDIDSLTTGIDEAIRTTQQTIAELAFRNAMSDGLAAMEAGQWAAAREALERAQTMRPDDRAPRDGLLKVARRFREASIQHYRDLALEAQQAERWSQALKHFDSVLEADPNVRFAQDGRIQAAARDQLDRRLVAFTRSPQRWWSDDGRRQAAELLVDARTVEAAGPRLDGQIRELERQLDLARRPVEVTLQSDSICNVVVYKVGRLGQFDTHSLKLQPGRYTAVGTRDGYRDVRKDFMVHAQNGAAPVVVRCEEEV